MATIDLKTLPKWKELPYGNHTLQIVARAPEHSDSDKSEGVTFTTVAKLATPQNVTANGTTVSWDAVENATSYDVYADNTVLLGSVASQSSVDLTTLSGWADLTDGNHTIQIVAKADGYQDSEKSAGVEVTKAPQAYTDCLTFTGKDSEFTLKATNKTWDGTLEWSTDHNTWTVLAGTEEMQSVNRKLYLRGKGNTTFYDTSLSKGVQWVLSNKASCSGNIQTLLDWENPPASISTEHCYSDMFNGCASLTSAPELPATTLAQSCYLGMFNGCASLTSAPQLPATTLALKCYQNMFNGCTSLTSAPELPATELPPTCYSSMFQDCTSLTSAPELPATTLSMVCYKNMFNGCTSLTSAPELPATELPPTCYSSMFQDCTSLTSAPQLPATTLAMYCYSDMFNGCTSLTSAPELPATELERGCYQKMFFDCSKLKVNSTSGSKIFTCPTTMPTYAVTDMFTNTGGTFTGTPTEGETYYYTE